MGVVELLLLQRGQSRERLKYHLNSIKSLRACLVTVEMPTKRATDSLVLELFHSSKKNLTRRVSMSGMMSDLKKYRSYKDLTPLII